jgi:NAD(P)-dependent dehydrogenase (short-subunit alcohol dehydrogenase family)
MLGKTTMEHQSARLADKVALITGGNQGIGKAIAGRFVAEGAKVMLIARNLEKLERAKAEFGADVCEVLQADVTIENDIERAVAHTVARFGRLDIGINNAGDAVYSKIVDKTEREFEYEVDLCLKGVFLSMKHEARQMMAQKSRGVIINISTLNGTQPGIGLGGYGAAKAGMEMMTRVAAMEMGPLIRVCSVIPGLIATERAQGVMDAPQILGEFLDNILLDRAGTPEDVANATLFLASDEASFITGHHLYVDGGQFNKRYPCKAFEQQRHDTFSG